MSEELGGRASIKRGLQRESGDAPIRAADEGPPAPSAAAERKWLHLLLFVLTALSVMATWALWSGNAGTSWTNLNPRFFREASLFAGALLFFLTVHEFGHYFAGRYHRVLTTLPFYIPLPLLGIGTLGAVIRIREPIPSIRKLFDIGVAGPVAGFIAAVGVLVLALAVVPGPDFVLGFAGHEEIKEYVETYGEFPDGPLPSADAPPGSTILIGNTLLYWSLSQLFADVPPMFEMYHYPLLFAGWLGLFFTALNLMPVGQLDGGHITYSLLGPRGHAWVARGFVLLLLLSGSVGLMAVPPERMPGWLATFGAGKWILLSGLLYVHLYRLFDRDHALIAPTLGGLVICAAIAAAAGPPYTSFGYPVWLVWTALLVFVLKVDHPPVLYAEPLTRGRRMLGYAAIAIFVLCFSFRPLYVV